ncbi:MAG TPA: FCD domain-containing protein [Aestuariivirgaceae bacterium]|nr:FCD domain-containing protein [Aestuariivirgaceae bacterium]
MEDAHGALTQLKAFLAQFDPAANPRVPPERELCEALGVSRGELRKALAILEQEGELWRHVGKGTFLGARPAEELSSVAAIAHRTNPREVMHARLLIEPQIAGEAALNATAAHITEMRQCLKGSQEALSWRHYESWDNRLHRTVAEATGNTVLLALFDTLNAVRRAVVWGRLRQQPERPPADHHSFAEHRAMVEAIVERDRPGAAAAMRRHLETVERNLLLARQAAE